MILLHLMENIPSAANLYNSAANLYNRLPINFQIYGMESHLYK